MFMAYTDYIAWHLAEYKRKPKGKLLQKYYPNDFREEDAEPEEVKIKPFIPSKVDMKFGGELEG